MAEERARPSPGATALRRFVSVSLLVLTTAFAAVYVVAPGARTVLVQENGVIQTTTAVVFLIAVIGGVVAIRNGRLVPGVYWLVPIGGFLGFVGETRFGTRLFGLPALALRGKEIDSFHDLFEVAVDAAADVGVGPAHLSGFAAVAAAITLYLIITGRLRRMITVLPVHRPLLLTLLALGALFLGLTLDLVGGGPDLAFLEETLELTAAALLTMAAVTIAEHHSAVVSWRRFSLELAADHRD